jgi:hypothetical protein
MLQSKLDGAFTQYHNEVWDMQAKSDELVRKNKSLRNKNKGTVLSRRVPIRDVVRWSKPMLTVYFGAPSMFITLWFGFDYGTNQPLGTLII